MNQVSNQVSIDIKERETTLDMTRSEQKHKHQLEDNKWSSCCFTLNKPAVLFFSHYFILVAVLITAIIGVFTDTINKDIWLNILMLCIGGIMPAPTLQHNKENK